MKPIVALTDFEIIFPSIMMDQFEVLEHMGQIHARSMNCIDSGREQIDNLIRRYAIKPTQISQRGFENIHIAADGKDIFELTCFFAEKSSQVLAQFYPGQSPPPDHLIHVTCTGYISPSPAQHLVNHNGWTEKTHVTHAYHMGCYAAFPAIRMAEGFVSARNQQVDIVHTEMCGLHMDPHNHSPEQLVIQSLFADGHVKYSAVQPDQAKNGFRVLNIREQMIPDSQADMSWTPASWGMKMTLSREVPKKIKSNLRPFIEKLVRDSPYRLDEVLKEAVFAVHPGGPKIIDIAKETLELSENQVQTSREILFERGNMSSATLPHVWQKLLEQKIPSNKLVVSLAFGPGLTIFGSLFETI